jgi:hypothetical protein
MEKLTQNNAPTFESVMALMQENAKQQKENERAFAETRQLFKETDKRQKKIDQLWEENERRWKKYERRMVNMEERVGSWSYNHGCFAEEYFFNSFAEEEQIFFGERFDQLRRCVKPKEKNLEDEYDIVLYNGTSVAIIEIKYKAHENDIPQVLKKAQTFRILCPSYKDYKIYLGLASLAFYPELEQKCIAEGIAIIKQVGDSVIINHEHLKVF